MTALNATTASKAPRRALRKAPRRVVRKAPRRVVAVAAVAAGAALALSGCSAGQISQTASQVAAVNGNSANVGKVALRDVRILLPQSEEYTNAKGGKALLAFSAINDGATKPDELASITSDLGQVKITPANPQLPFQQTLVAGKRGEAHASAPSSSAAPSSTAPSSTPASGTSASAAPTTTGAAAGHQAEGHGAAEHPAEPAAPILVEITGLTRDVTPGLTYQVTFNFKENGTVQVPVPVDAGPDTARKEGAPAAEGEHKGGH
ncbi:hypothetical protein [Nocardia wallacei]|uniref:hypothetical protein n=1 Tax=Nocardia wallacei TaxID=480035 RepID=UPI00245476F2|nr:hypothetical protein [Nocardia wallacei]